MKISCPFCDEDMSDAHEAIDAIGKLQEGKSVCICCDSCGEPLFAETEGFRKPTELEYLTVITHPEVRFSRAVHIQKQKYEQPLGAEWKRLETHLETAMNQHGQHIPDIGKAFAKAMFVSGLLAALKHVKEAHNAIEDAAEEAANFFLMEAEAHFLKDSLDNAKALIPA